MSSYKPKSLDELNSMYDKALSAQRAIKRGTSKINETNSSDSFFDDVIKEAELTVSKEPEKRIADLSVAVDDFIKHFSEPEKEKYVPVPAPAVPVNAQPKVKTAEAPKTTEAPKIKTEKKAAIVATPSPAIARKQSGEHISSLMSDYIKIMNDQDDSDEDEPKHRKSFLTRKKEKKLASKESFKEEEATEEESFDEPSYTPLSDEMKDEVFSLDGGSVSFDELSEEEKPSAASEEAFNAFSAMSRKKETFHKEVIVEEPAAEEEEEVSEEEAPECTEEADEEAEATEAYEEAEAEETETEAEESAEDEFDDVSSVSEEAENAEEDTEEEAEEEFEEELPGYSKGKNALRVITRVFLSLVCVVTLVLSLFCASLSTVFNINTGKEVFGKYYFFTSSHDFVVSGVKAGDLVVCEKKTTVSDDETAVYIDLENRTFSFGVKDGSMTNGEGDIIYLIGENEVPRDDVLGTVYKTVPLLGDAITIVYEYYVPVISVLVISTAVLLLVIIFALKKRKTEEYLPEESEEDEDAEEQQEYTDEADEDIEADIFAELD